MIVATAINQLGGGCVITQHNAQGPVNEQVDLTGLSGPCNVMVIITIVHLDSTNETQGPSKQSCQHSTE